METHPSAPRLLFTLARVSLIFAKTTLTFPATHDRVFFSPSGSRPQPQLPVQLSGGGAAGEEPTAHPQAAQVGCEPALAGVQGDRARGPERRPKTPGRPQAHGIKMIGHLPFLK